MISGWIETSGLSLYLTEDKVGNEIARTQKGWFKSTATDSALTGLRTET
jgi:hypothetical protein